MPTVPARVDWIMVLPVDVGAAYVVRRVAEVEPIGPFAADLSHADLPDP